MPRSQYEASSLHSSAFLDRREHLAVIAEHVALLGVDPAHLQVFEIDGLGGVGKSRLMREVCLRMRETDESGPVCWVQLDSEAFTTETGPLLAIRDQVAFDCLLFDTAIVAYWNAIGQPLQLLDQSRLSNSIVLKVLDAGGATAGIPVPFAFAAELFRAARKGTTKFRHYTKDEFEAIDSLRLDPAALRLRLPHYLGLDVRRRLIQTEQSIVVFYDGYDRQTQKTRLRKAPWLREFVATIGRGVHIIATRESMEWPRDEWGGVLRQVFLDKLPEEESRQMVRARLGELDHRIEARLIEASQGLPFFLEAAIDAYAARTHHAPIATVDELPSSPDASISYLLEHLETEHCALAVALATVQCFDRPLFAHLVRELNVHVGRVTFDQFRQWFFVLQTPEGPLRIHDLLTEFVRASGGHPDVRDAALASTTRYLFATCAPGTSSESLASALPLFRGLMEGWASAESVPTEFVEFLVDIGYVFYDAGYWHGLVALGRDGSSGHPTIDLVRGLFLALSTRRIESVHDALELLEPLEARFELLGRHRRSAALEVAYLSEISGDYLRARQDFALLDRAPGQLDPEDRTSVRARLYHADMLVMDGDFVQGSRLLLEACETAETRSPVDWAELVRHRAHAFRFSFALPEAEQLYRRAIVAAANSPSLLGKLHTNLAETLCWHEPERALEAARLADDLNTRVGSRIELAKACAARAIALSRLGESRAAGDLAAEAVRGADAAGYPAGVAFGCQAAAIADAAAGGPQEAGHSRRELDAAIERIGTYSHLRLAPAWAVGDGPGVQAASTGAAWIRGSELPGRLTAYVGRGPVS